MTTVSELPIESYPIAQKDFDACRRQPSQEHADKLEHSPIHAISTASMGLLDRHTFAEWRFDLIHQTDELVDVMYSGSNH
jgi:hypothetical protein